MTNNRQQRRQRAIRRTDALPVPSPGAPCPECKHAVRRVDRDPHKPANGQCAYAWTVKCFLCYRQWNPPEAMVKFRANMPGRLRQKLIAKHQNTTVPQNAHIPIESALHGMYREFVAEI